MTDRSSLPRRASLELLRAEASDELSVLVEERLRDGEDPWDFMEDLPTVDELVASVGDAVGVCRERLAGEPGALIAVHCGGRRGGIGDRIGEVSEQLKKSAGGLPYIGVFTFGEYGFEKGSANGCGGLMLSFMLLGK